MSYVVISPVVLAKVETADGIQYRYFTEGSVLPESTSQETIDHLLAIPMIELVGAAAPVDDRPTNEDGESLNKDGSVSAHQPDADPASA